MTCRTIATLAALMLMAVSPSAHAALVYPTITPVHVADFPGSPQGAMSAIAGVAEGYVEEHMGYYPDPYGSQPDAPFWYEPGAFSVYYSGEFANPYAQLEAEGSYDHGVYPDVTGNVAGGTDPLVLEVHQGGVFTGKLWLRTGEYVAGAGTPDQVVWGGATEYQSGYYPSISFASMNGQRQIVEAHSGSNGYGPDNTIWILTATSPSGLTTASASPIPSVSGWNPRVTVAPSLNGVYFVIVVYQQTGAMTYPGTDYAGYPTTGPLGYSTGYLRPGASSVSWTSHGTYDSGALPSIAICAEGPPWNGTGNNSLGDMFVLEIHNGGGSATGPEGLMWMHVGVVNGAANTVVWNPSGQPYLNEQTYDSPPHVTCGGGFAVETHVTGSTLRLGSIVLE